MELEYDSRYPSVDDLRERARRRIPRFAFEYLDGGCNNDVNLHRNTAEIRDVELIPQYLSEHAGLPQFSVAIAYCSAEQTTAHSFK